MGGRQSVMDIEKDAPERSNRNIRREVEMKEKSGEVQNNKSSKEPVFRILKRKLNPA